MDLVKLDRWNRRRHLESGRNTLLAIGVTERQIQQALSLVDQGKFAEAQLVLTRYIDHS